MAHPTSINGYQISLFGDQRQQILSQLMTFFADSHHLRALFHLQAPEFAQSLVFCPVNNGLWLFPKDQPQVFTSIWIQYSQQGSSIVPE
jgi:hypothetical protein